MATKKIKGALEVESTLNVSSSISVGGTDLAVTYHPYSANGYAELSDGKIQTSQLPASVMEYQGTFDDGNPATPDLKDGTGSAGDVYIVTTAGSAHDFDPGAGTRNISVAIGDWLIYNGTQWEKVLNSTTAVAAVNVSYDNSTSGLAATNVKGAIDALAIQDFILDGRVDANDLKVSADGSVTTHNDVTDAGSGAIITGSERAKLAGIEPLADVTNSSNVDAAGAVMESDITAGGSGRVIDDDTMATASNTTIATSESIKAYVDAQVGGGGGASSLDGLSDVTITGPGEGNDILIYNAVSGQFVDKLLTGGTGIIINGDASSVGFDLDINGMTELAEASSQPTSDEVALYDGSALEHKKISVKNLTGRAVGDIHETEFTLPTGNLATTATDLTGLSFSNTNVRSFEAQVIFEASTDSVTGGSVEVYKLLGVSRSLAGEAATWDLAVESVGDNVNVSFTITTAGQVQYSFPSPDALPSGTYDSDSGNFRFRASTISTASGQSV